MKLATPTITVVHTVIAHYAHTLSIFFCCQYICIYTIRGIPIDASDPTLAARCTNTTEAGELYYLYVL